MNRRQDNKGTEEREPYPGIVVDNPPEPIISPYFEEGLSLQSRLWGKLHLSIKRLVLNEA